MLFLTWEMLWVLSPSAPSHSPVPVLAHCAVPLVLSPYPNVSSPLCDGCQLYPGELPPAMGFVQLLPCSMLQNGALCGLCPAASPATSPHRGVTRSASRPRSGAGCLLPQGTRGRESWLFPWHHGVAGSLLGSVSKLHGDINCS